MVWNKATIDIEWENYTIKMRYQASLGYVIELSCINNNDDAIEFESVEDY